MSFQTENNILLKTNLNVLVCPVQLHKGIRYEQNEKLTSKSKSENEIGEEVSLILFPHGFPADIKNQEAEIKTNDYVCQSYEDAFNVPVTSRIKELFCLLVNAISFFCFIQ